MTILTRHAVERAKERYGLDLVEADGAEILAQIRAGKAPCMKKNDDGRVYIARLMGKTVIASFHPNRDVITTFMPRDYFSKGSRMEHKQRAGMLGKTTPQPHVAAEPPHYSRAAMQRETRAAKDGEE